MSLSKGQLMTQYQNTRKELGTITYSRLVKPNILDDYTLYLKDLTEMEELDKTKENLVADKQPKNINITKKKSLYDFLENKKDPEKESDGESELESELEPDKESELESDKESDRSEQKNNLPKSKILEITVSTEPDAKSNKLLL